MCQEDQDDQDLIGSRELVAEMTAKEAREVASMLYRIVDRQDATITEQIATIRLLKEDMRAREEEIGVLEDEIESKTLLLMTFSQ